MQTNKWGRKLHFRDAISGYYGLQSAIVSFDPIHLFIMESLKYSCVVNNLAGSERGSGARHPYTPQESLPCPTSSFPG